MHHSDRNIGTLDLIIKINKDICFCELDLNPFLICGPVWQGRALYHISKAFTTAASKLEKIGYGI